MKFSVVLLVFLDIVYIPVSAKTNRFLTAEDENIYDLGNFYPGGGRMLQRDYFRPNDLCKIGHGRYVNCTLLPKHYIKFCGALEVCFHREAMPDDVPTEYYDNEEIHPKFYIDRDKMFCALHRGRFNCDRCLNPATFCDSAGFCMTRENFNTYCSHEKKRNKLKAKLDSLKQDNFTNTTKVQVNQEEPTQEAKDGKGTPMTRGNFTNTTDREPMKEANGGTVTSTKSENPTNSARVDADKEEPNSRTKEQKRKPLNLGNFTYAKSLWGKLFRHVKNHQNGSIVEVKGDERNSRRQEKRRKENPLDLSSYSYSKNLWGNIYGINNQTNGSSTDIEVKGNDVERKQEPKRGRRKPLDLGSFTYSKNTWGSLFHNVENQSNGGQN